MRAAWRTLLPFLAGGLAGLPLGLWLLPRLDVPLFKFLLGTMRDLDGTVTLSPTLEAKLAQLLAATPELIVGRDTHLRYVVDAELYYLTGYPEPDAVAVLDPHLGTVLDVPAPVTSITEFCTTFPLPANCTAVRASVRAVAMRAL